jgi:hypothetical protein
VKRSYALKILLFVIAVAMVVGGLGVVVFGKFIIGGVMLVVAGLYLLWEDFIAPLFTRR